MDSGPARLEVTTVVTEVDDGVAQVGFTDLEAGLFSQWFHLPPAGAIGTEDLAWEIHDEPASLLAFPLTDGASWNGTFEGEHVNVSATRVGDAAEGVFRLDASTPDAGTVVSATYDARLGQFSNIELLYGGEDPWARATLLDHGSGFAEPVHVLDAQDLFLGGSAPPTFLAEPETIPVPAGATHLVLGCEMAGLPGSYRAQLDGPAGRSLVCDHQNTDPGWSSDTQIRPGEAEPGDWLLTLVPATAQGFVSAEVVAVVAQTVEPPQG